jgi:hypothetical protein
MVIHLVIHPRRERSVEEPATPDVITQSEYP